MTDSAPSPSPPGDPPAQDASSISPWAVGVLLVHGVGEQQRGDTLVRFGEPIIDWIRRWIGPAGAVSVTSAAIARQTTAGPDGPARFELAIDPGSVSGHIALRALAHQAVYKPAAMSAARAGEGTPDKSAEEADRDTASKGPDKWLVAESWWAPHARRPPFGKLARWMLSRGPWVLISHYGDGLRVAPGWRKVPAALEFLASIVAALLLQVLVATIALLAAVPWPRLRDALSGLLLALTGTLGDSYVLVESPVQRAAAVTEVRQDLEWLAEQCGQYSKIVVIAHSQGAAIAREAIHTAGKPVAALVTFGQGLRKLEELRHLTENWSWYFSAISFSLPLTALVVGLSVYPPPELQQSENLGMARYFLIGYPGLVLYGILAAAVTGSAYRRELAELKLPGTRWIDFFTGADPVPGGPLQGSILGVTSTKVHNLASLTRDHTAYWENRDQFVASIVREIELAAGHRRLIDRPAEGFVESVGAARALRVRVLALVRWASLLSVPLAAYGLRGELREMGQVVLGPVLRVPLIRAVGALVQEMGSFVEHIALVLPCAAFGGLAAWCGAGEPLADGFAAVAVTLLALAAAAWYALAERMWHTWDNLSIRPLFAPTQPGERNEQRLVACAVVLIGLVPLGVAAAMATGAGVQDVRVFMWNAVWIAPMLPMAVALLLAPLVLLGYGGWALIVGYRKLRGR